MIICACGCKQPLNTLWQPARFINGHQNRNRKKQWRVNKQTGCWEWLLGKRRGYGVMRDPQTGKHRYAHVVNYEKKYGPVPEGKELDHFKCDNLGCCNPDHVKPATHAENVRRGRSTKLTIQQVKQIRAAKDVSGVVLGKRYGVSPGNISHIRNGNRWREQAQHL